MRVCVKIDQTLPCIANVVKHEQAVNKLKDFFRVQSERLLLKSVSCLFFLSLWKAVMTLCFTHYFSVASVFWGKKRKCLHFVSSCHLSFINLLVFYW